MFKIASVFCTVLLLAGVVQAQTAPTPPTPPTAEQIAARAQGAVLVAANTRPFVLTNAGVNGPGADFLRDRTSQAQFVLVGEAHFDHDTPVFSRGLYQMLQSAHGFDRLVVENDPLAMAAVEAFAGDLNRTVDLARRYPSHIGFSSDQDLELYATAAMGASEVWGIEQAQGATRYLEELERLAPTAALRADVSALLSQARTQETWDERSAFLHDDPTVTPRFQALASAWAPLAGSRAEVLLRDLIRSSIIYGYNRRAGEGEQVGLYNNTDREDLFRENFLRLYRADASDGRMPKVMFKMGGWHTYRGKSPGQAYTIGNFAHEFAIANGSEAYGISVLPIGGYASSLSDFPEWMRTFLPATAPDGPVVIDLRPLKPWVGLFSIQSPPGDRWQIRDFLYGHDALVILPNSRKATWDLTGFSAP